MEKPRLICLDVCSLAISGGSFCKKLTQQRLTYRCLPYVIQCLIYRSHTTRCTKIQKSNLSIFFGWNCSLAVFLKILVFYRFCFYEILNKDIRIRPVNKKMALKRPIFDLFTTEYSAEANNYIQSMCSWRKTTNKSTFSCQKFHYRNSNI